jgi:hypothetical protein
VGCQLPGPAADLLVDPRYADVYKVYSLGSVPGVPPQRYGGLTLERGDSNKLLIGGNANDPTAALYAIRVVRSCGHIIGFEGTATRFADAPNVDGGLDYGPGGILLFTGYNVNTIGQIRPGEATVARTTDLAMLGIDTSVGALRVVPAGFSSAGSLKVISWSGGQWRQLGMAAGADGLLELTAGVPPLAITLPGGPEGFAYVPQGSPHFDRPSLVVSEWSAGKVSTYEADAAGDPLPATRKELLTGFRGAEGAYFDPGTGDFLFSTWSGAAGSERVIIIHGFVPIG